MSVSRIELSAPDGKSVAVCLDSNRNVTLEPAGEYIWHQRDDRPGVLLLEPIDRAWRMALKWSIEYEYVPALIDLPKKQMTKRDFGA